MPNPLEALENEKNEPPSEANQASFALLVEQHHAKLYSFIYRYTKNRQDAEDLTQDTFVKAFKNFHRYDSKYAFSSWLFTIGRRTVYNHYRAKKSTDALAFEIVDPSQTPDKRAEGDDRKRQLWKAAKSLKKDYYEVLILKYIEDLSIKEIAQVLNKTETNVKILLFRARNKLKAKSKCMPPSS